jgi:LysR family cys regulon transcriptional activator
MRDLQDELGVELFVRHGKRLLGLTGPGTEMVEVVERILRDTHALRAIASEYQSRDDGALHAATKHTEVRYALPKVVAAFRERYPRVHLNLYEAAPEQVAVMLADGRADIGVITTCAVTRLILSSCVMPA